MKELRLDYPLEFVRRVLSVSASGYYAWVDRPLSKWAQEEARLEVEIRAAHKRTRQVCGVEKLKYELAEYGIQVGICRIKRIRKKLGIRCKQKRKFKMTTDSRHKLPVAENLLKQQFKVSQPNKVWLSDITYVPTAQGWLYLAVVLDLYSRRIVGWAMSDSLHRQLVITLCRWPSPFASRLRACCITLTGAVSTPAMSIKLC
jgi:transposase InsO family protein